MSTTSDKESSARSRRQRSLPNYLQDYDLSDLPTRSQTKKSSESQSREQLDEEDRSRPSQLHHSPARWSVPDKWESSADEWRRECHILEREREDLLAAMEELKIQNEQLRAKVEPSSSRPEPRTVTARDRLYREGLEYGGASTQYKSVYFRDRETPPQRSSDRHHDYRESTRYDSPSPKRSPEPSREGRYSSHYNYEQSSHRRSPERHASYRDSCYSYREYREPSRQGDYSPARRRSNSPDQRDRRSFPSPRHEPRRRRSVTPPGGQERTYRGPTPTIPNFNRPNPRDFARLRIALDNLLPRDATERFKFQILVDHLKLEEALLVADSYSNSDYPFTDTMAALNQQYGQPHQLALQRIAELMDGPNIQSGDIKSFRLFALNVRSLVSMLEQLGLKGQVELDCGSHVTRLLGKLPHDLRSSLRRYIHPLRIPIPTLLDLADWLEYELQIQEDIAQYRLRKDTGSKPKDSKSTVRSSPKASVLMLGAREPAKSTPPTSLDAKKFCPFCENYKHTLNSCANFKLLSATQKRNWIQDNNRCWRCGREHRSAECDLKMCCKTCNSRHLLALHDVSEKSLAKADKAERRPDQVKSSESKPLSIPSADQVLYIGKPPQGHRVLLKVSKVILRHGDQTLETYAVLDDGSERTLLLQPAVQHLGLEGQPEDLPLRTVRQELQTLHGAAVSFSISPACSPAMKFSIPSFKDIVPLLLIGSDHPHLVTPVEPVIFGPPGAPVAVRTRLGWTLQGPTNNLKQYLIEQRSDIYQHVERLWQLDVLPWRSEKASTRSRQDKEALECLDKQTVRVDVNGVHRYATPLLRVKNFPQLCAPKEAVLPQLRNTERRLAKNPETAQVYNAEIQILEQAGYVAKLPHGTENTLSSWYIPHHLV
ncbi:unnamed protein product [Leuciscus chuanchicus]